MTSSEFNTQMQRMISTFGKIAYGEERAQLVWKEVSQYSLAWFAGVVDEFIGNHRLPPLLSDFASAATDERIRLWKIEKQRNADDATKFWDCTWTDEQIRNTCQDIIAIIRHNGETLKHGTA